MKINPEMSYNNNRSHYASGYASASEDIYGSYGKEWRDSITTPNAGQLLRTYGLNRIKDNNKSNGYNLHASSSYTFCFSPAHDSRFGLEISGKIDFNNSVNRDYDHYYLEYIQTSGSEFRNRHIYNKTQGLRHDIVISTNNMYFSQNRFSIGVEYQYSDKKQMQNRSLYLLNKLDAWGEETGHSLGELPSVDEMLQALDNGNSYWQQEDNYINSIRVQFQARNYNWNKDIIPKIAVSGVLRPQIIFHKDHLHYQRGVLDTLVCRNNKFPGIEAEVSFFPEGKNWPRPWQINLNYKMDVTQPNMDYLVDYRDDSNPLNIMLGNPHLVHITWESSLNAT